MELRIYLRMLQRGWWIILIAAITAVNVSLLVSYFTPPLYRTSATFLISPNPNTYSRESDLIDSVVSLDKRSIIMTYAEVLRSDRIYDQAMDDLEIVDGSQYDAAVAVLPDSSIIELTVIGPEPVSTANLANAMGQHSIEFLNIFYNIYQIQFLDVAEVRETPFTPQVWRDGVIALALGVLTGSLLAILRDQMQISLDTLLARSMYDNETSAFSRQYFMRAVQKEIASNTLELHALGIVQFEGLIDLAETLPPILLQRAMRELFKKIKNELRGYDLVGRWSETSFAIFLPATPESAAMRTMTRIQQALDLPFKLDDTEEVTIDFLPRAGLTVRHGSEPSQDFIDRTERALKISLESRKDVHLEKVSAFTSEALV